MLELPLVVLPAAPEVVSELVVEVFEPYWPAEFIEPVAPEVVFVPTPAFAELGALGDVELVP